MLASHKLGICWTARKGTRTVLKRLLLLEIHDTYIHLSQTLTDVHIKSKYVF